MVLGSWLFWIFSVVVFKKKQASFLYISTLVLLGRFLIV